MGIYTCIQSYQGLDLLCTYTAFSSIFCDHYVTFSAILGLVEVRRHQQITYSDFPSQNLFPKD